MDFLGGAIPDPTAYTDYNPAAPQNAALYVAFMFGLAAVFLFLMKKTGFRAMVAVGRS